MATSTRQVPTFHAHGCLGCGRRYQDGLSCPDRFVNGRCTTCRTGQPVSMVDLDHMPVTCCTTQSKLITDVNVLKAYALGGNGNWWRCHGCGRTHPFNPKKEAHDTAA